jgi:hypothetical protein
MSRRCRHISEAVHFRLGTSGSSGSRPAQLEGMPEAPGPSSSPDRRPPPAALLTRSSGRTASASAGRPPNPAMALRKPDRSSSHAGVSEKACRTSFARRPRPTSASRRPIHTIESPESAPCWPMATSICPTWRASAPRAARAELERRLSSEPAGEQPHRRGQQGRGAPRQHRRERRPVHMAPDLSQRLGWSGKTGRLSGRESDRRTLADDASRLRGCARPCRARPCRGPARPRRRGLRRDRRPPGRGS